MFHEIGGDGPVAKVMIESQDCGPKQRKIIDVPLPCARNMVVLSSVLMHQFDPSGSVGPDTHQLVRMDEEMRVLGMLTSANQIQTGLRLLLCPSGNSSAVGIPSSPAPPSSFAHSLYDGARRPHRDDVRRRRESEDDYRRQRRQYESRHDHRRSPSRDRHYSHRHDDRDYHSDYRYRDEREYRRPLRSRTRSSSPSESYSRSDSRDRGRCHHRLDEYSHRRRRSTSRGHRHDDHHRDYRDHRYDDDVDEYRRRRHRSDSRDEHRDRRHHRDDNHLHEQTRSASEKRYRSRTPDRQQPNCNHLKCVVKLPAVFVHKIITNRDSLVRLKGTEIIVAEADKVRLNSAKPKGKPSNNVEHLATISKLPDMSVTIMASERRPMENAKMKLDEWSRSEVARVAERVEYVETAERCHRAGLKSFDISAPGVHTSFFFGEEMAALKKKHQNIEVAVSKYEGNRCVATIFAETEAIARAVAKELGPQIKMLRQQRTKTGIQSQDAMNADSRFPEKLDHEPEARPPIVRAVVKLPAAFVYQVLLKRHGLRFFGRSWDVGMSIANSDFARLNSETKEEGKKERGKLVNTLAVVSKFPDMEVNIYDSNEKRVENAKDALERAARDKDLIVVGSGECARKIQKYARQRKGLDTTKVEKPSQSNSMETSFSTENQSDSEDDYRCQRRQYERRHDYRRSPSRSHEQDRNLRSRTPEEEQQLEVNPKHSFRAVVKLPAVFVHRIIHTRRCLDKYQSFGRVKISVAESDRALLLPKDEHGNSLNKNEGLLVVSKLPDVEVTITGRRRKHVKNTKARLKSKISSEIAGAAKQNARTMKDKETTERCRRAGWKSFDINPFSVPDSFFDGVEITALKGKHQNIEVIRNDVGGTRHATLFAATEAVGEAASQELQMTIKKNVEQSGEEKGTSRKGE